MKKYSIALFQCYQRYLNEFGSFHMQDFQTVDEIEEKFFPQGLSDVTADISVYFLTIEFNVQFLFLT